MLDELMPLLLFSAIGWTISTAFGVIVGLAVVRVRLDQVEKTADRANTRIDNLLGIRTGGTD